MPNNDRAQRRLNAKRAAKQNRHQLEALRREQAKRERRRFYVVTGIVVLVGLIIVGSVAVPAILKNVNSPGHKDLTSFGAAAASAGCDPEVKTPLEPGPAAASTQTADAQDRYHLTDGTPWSYKTNPPASGPHNVTPMPTDVHYYAPGSASQPQFVEQLVHNLEHGFVVAWYDDTIAQDAGKLQALQDIGTNLAQKSSDPYFIAAPWPKDRPAMPTGKHVALTSWHAQTLCADISGAAVQTVVNAHPTLCAPEDPTGSTKAQIEAACGVQPTPSTSASTTTTLKPTTSASASPSTSPSPSPGTTTTAPASPSATPSASAS
ncbi:MAG: hypothetical protein JWM93_745 [Frankiales bacterium]|nr:hypothetical protein [Frankiales bacterium]